MYSFEPTEEQKMLIDSVNRYAVNDLQAKAHDADEEGLLPEKLVQKGWDLGILQASIPDSYGGFGERSAVTGVLATEEMAYGDMAGTIAVMTPGLFAMPLLLVGSEEQKQTYLPEIVEGAWAPYTAALLEMRFDFDPSDLQTMAVETADGYLLNGEKIYVPYAEGAKAMLVYARLGEQTQGFIVPGDAPGLQVVERQKTLGLYALPLYKVAFKDVAVPKSARLGGEAGHAMEPIQSGWWLAMAAIALGVSRAAFDYSRDYAKEREVFGVKVAQKQAIAFMLAEMATEIEAIRLLAWEAAWMVDKGLPEAARQSYLAWIGATDMAMMVTDRAVQILGGHGYIREHPVERWMRNGRGIAMLNGLAIV